MTHASLCTGIGACELAASWMGWENLFSCEINEFCNKVLKHHYPNAEHYEDIYKTDFSGWNGKVDVLTAGFPCQPFSCAGARKGAEDDRYLWPEVLRAIGEIRPAWFVGENVDGITSMVLPDDEIEVGNYTDITGESYTIHEKHERFVVDRICGDLESIGYTVQPIVIPACGVGAPHKRYRIWFLASDTDRSGLQEERPEQQAARIAGSGLQRDVANPADPGFKNVQRKRENGILPVGIITDTQCVRGNKIHEEIQPEQPNGNQFNGTCGEWDASDTDSERLQGGGIGGEYSKKREEQHDKQPLRLFRPNWENFPTQPPVCSRDDGLSGRLSGITFSKWRIESVKALGNSMVPQVVFEIFRAIELVDKTD